MFLVFSNHFDVLISKIIFKKSKNIIDMHFGMKSYLKSNHNHTAKQALDCTVQVWVELDEWHIYVSGRVKFFLIQKNKC